MSLGPNLAQKYRGQWRQILTSLGIPARFLRNVHGPCPACGGKDRFRFDDKQGRGTYYCNRCGAGDGPELAMLVLGLSFNDLVARLQASSIHRSSERIRLQTASVEMKLSRNQQVAMDLWASAKALQPGDAGYVYLLRRLGRAIDSPTLRLTQECVHPGPPVQRCAALLACFSDAAGKPTAVQRIFLTGDGQSAALKPKRMGLGPQPQGGAVRLAPVSNVIGIAEGVETALAATILFGVPCWATLGSSLLASWQPPPGVDEVLILGDHDVPGIRAATALLQRIRGTVQARIDIPSKEGRDWNDVLLERLGRR